MNLLRIGFLRLRVFFLDLRRVDHTIKQRRHINVIFLLKVSNDLLFHQLLGFISRNHLGVHDTLQVGFGKPCFELSEGLNDIRFDFVHRNFIAEKQVKILDLDRALVVSVYPTHQSTLAALQFEDQLGVLAVNAFFSRQAGRHKLGIVDSSALIEVHTVEQLAELLLVGGDREEIVVLGEGFLVAERHERVAELRIERAMSLYFFEGDPAVVLLVEVLEEIAQTHEVVLQIVSIRRENVV